MTANQYEVCARAPNLERYLDFRNDPYFLQETAVSEVHYKEMPYCYFN